MERNQKINCSVISCKYNNRQDQECNLKTIVVTPKKGVQTKQPNESVCSSYEYTEDTQVVKKY